MPSELENLRLQLAGFARFTTRALVESNLDALLLDACIRARAATRVSHAKVLEYLPAEDRLLLRAGIGWKPGYVGVYTAPADMDTAIGYAFNLCEPVPVSDYQTQSQFGWPDILKDHGCVSSVNVPLRGETGVFGVLEVDHREVRHYTTDDLHFLTALGNTVARAVELNRLHAAKDRALAEKDLLMREMNHRIKNNLTLVASMLALQRRGVGAADVKREFDDAINRIYSLAHVHDRLQRQSPNESDAASYFSDWCGMLRSLVPKNVQLNCHGRGALPVENIEAFSLLVNELVTNACKYAFPQGRAGEIEISFIDTGEGWKLTVHDNGVGLPPDFEVHNPSSLGMRLIHSFAAQLGAAVTYNKNGGTLVEVMSAFGAHRPNPT